MFICIPDILTAGQLSELAGAFERQSLVDGRTTAGGAAVGVKNNLQIPADASGHAAMQAMVSAALQGSRPFTLAAMPRTMRPILFSRYLTGMSYGVHVDNALMGENPSIRCDLAFTCSCRRPTAMRAASF